MKLIFGVLLIIYFVAIIKTEEEENDLTESQQLMLSFAKDCINMTNPSEEDILIFVNMDLPQSQEGKCLSACIMKQIHIIVDGKYNPPNLIQELRKIAPKDDEDLPVMEEIAIECESVTDSDTCELAFKIISCFEEKASAKGLEKAE